MPETPKVSYPGRRRTDVETEPERISMLEAGGLEEAFERLVMRLLAAIDEVGGDWTSAHERLNENPPSAAVHLSLGGKRYVAILQPLDMSDRSKLEAG